MARSQLLSEMGFDWEIAKAITHEVHAQGGGDENVRRILNDKDVCKAIAKILVAKQLFTFVVDFNDAKWRSLPSEEENCFVGSEVKAVHFPICHTGKAEVTVEIVSGRNKTFAEHMASQKERPACLIDRAISETFLRQFPEERAKGPIYAICGTYYKDGADTFVAYCHGDRDGIDLLVDHTTCRLNEHCCFLILREVKILAP